jgi:hypothetical protein
MTRGLSHFRQGDLARALRAVRSAGMKVARVEVGADGKLAVIVEQNGNKESETANPNPWDDVLNDHDQA